MTGLFRRAFARDGRLTILDVPIAPLDLGAAAEGILTYATTIDGGVTIACPTGAHGLVAAARDDSFRSVLSAADLVLADGMPLTWIGRAAGFVTIGRVFGPDLMLEVCRQSVERNIRHFLCGGGEGVAPLLADRLATLFPGLRISGVLTPPRRPLTDDDLRSIARTFTQSGGHILWLGVSTPKQERWAASLKPLLSSGVLVTVGAAFDYNTGRIQRAPHWLQASGLEWCVRLLQDPLRLAPRYILTIPVFFLLLLRQLAGLGRHGRQ